MKGILLIFVIRPESIRSALFSRKLLHEPLCSQLGNLFQCPGFFEQVGGSRNKGHFFSQFSNA